MANSDKVDERAEVLFADLLRPLVPRRSHIKKGTILATIIAALLGGVYFFVQPTTRSASLGFRPIFDGAQAGRYPNSLPFSPTDIVDASIVNQVFAKNSIQEYCAPGVFQSGFVVQESSPGLQFLNLEYQAQLSDTRLTAVDRERLQEEYANRRTALQPQYELLFLQPPQCSGVPQAIVFKAMAEILETWATDADTRRGVMKFRISVLTPRIFEQPETDESLLVQADLLRTAVVRVIANIAAVERLPGAELVRGSDRSTSLAEVRAELEDLLQARLDPLIAVAGRGLGASSLRFLQQALRSSEIQLRAAQQRTETYRQALREYSGVGTPPATEVSTGDRQQNPSDVQALTPQIDRTFIDRIVDLSAANTTFRQEITREAIIASIEAVERGAVVEQYRQLLSSLAQGGNEELAIERVKELLNRVGGQAKDATRRFNEIYDEYVRVSLRPGPAMYRVERPVESSAVRAFSLRNYLLAVLAVAVSVPILLAVVFLVQYHIRRFVSSVQ